MSRARGVWGIRQKWLFIGFGQVRTHAQGALSAFDQPEDSLGEQVLVDTYQASQMLARRGCDTYDELISVGANDAIAGVSVRNRLANFYRSLQAQIVRLQPEIQCRNSARSHMPYTVQSAILKLGIRHDLLVELPISI